jgi:hypothetical protein
MALALLLGAGDAQAFKPEVHQVYTQRAIAAYRHCASINPGFPAAPDSDLESVAIGTAAEDSTDKFSRATHWHYAGNDAMWKKLLFIFDVDLDGIFGKRVEDLHESASGRGADWRSAHFQRAGRVLHYIQDMRVPAHVIPIHHGFSTGHDDQLDGFLYDEPGQGEPMTSDTCAAIASAVVPCEKCLRKRLDDARDDTQAMLGIKASQAKPSPENANPVTRCWREVFWCKPEAGTECPGAAYPGFGAYRTGDDALAFGQEKTVMCGGRAVRFTRKDYLEFFRDNYRKMIEDTVYLMLYAVRLAK